MYADISPLLTKKRKYSAFLFKLPSCEGSFRDAWR